LSAASLVEFSTIKSGHTISAGRSAQSLSLCRMALAPRHREGFQLSPSRMLPEVLDFRLQAVK
jgi:hypothetical protein